MRKFKKIIGPYLTIIFIALFVIYFALRPHEFKPLLEISILILVFVGLAKVLTNIASGIFLKITIEAFTARMRMVEGLYISILSSIGNYFGPLLGGTSVRAIYLKQNFSLSYSNFASTLAGYYEIVFLANSILALVSIGLLVGNPVSSPIFLFFLVWLLALLGILFIKLPDRNRAMKKLKKWRSPKPIIKAVEIIYDIERGWKLIMSQRMLMAKLFLLAVLGFVITFVTAWLEFSAIGVEISAPALGLYTALSGVSLLIAITPGAIGIRESLLVVNSSLMGVTSTQVLQVAVIDRGVSFITLFLLFLLTKVIKVKMKVATD